MDLFYQILALTLTLFLMFFLIRGVTRMYIDSVLTKRQRKTRAKKQTFFEWFFYRRFLGVLPKFSLVWYYINFAVYFVMVIAVIILKIVGIPNIGRDIVWVYFAINAVFLISFRFTCVKVDKGQKP
ncbi:MAG: hypothetical protein E7650_00270 [Ruminococcaceae bacterium]|nr:hypothetical protein [Oscillospiraceae bacterium]